MKTKKKKSFRIYKDSYGYYAMAKGWFGFWWNVTDSYIEEFGEECYTETRIVRKQTEERMEQYLRERFGGEESDIFVKQIEI